MGSSLTLLQKKAEQLSPQRQSELIDFAEFLLNKERMGKSALNGATESKGEPLTRGLKFDWCAGPDAPSVEMTSVEMQHEVLEWMAQKAEEHLSKR
jgi:hypothetical protein